MSDPFDKLLTLIDEYGTTAMKAGQANSGVAIDFASGSYRVQMMKLHGELKSEIEELRSEIESRCKTHWAVIGNRVLNFYLKTAGRDVIDEEVETQVGDLVAHLCHLVKDRGGDPNRALGIGFQYYALEIDEDIVLGG